MKFLTQAAVSLTLENTPFRHASAEEFVTEQFSHAFLVWLESTVYWGYQRIDGFYEDYDINLLEVSLDEKLEVIKAHETLEILRAAMEDTFGVHLSKSVDVAVHKLLAGQVIRVHTDFGERGQSHRLLIQLNRGWRANQGGLLLLLPSAAPKPGEAGVRCFVPRNGLATCFEVSARSYHAVTPVEFGERFTLCYSFRVA